MSLSLSASLDEIEQLIRGMRPEARAELEERVKPLLTKVWLPQGGKQSQAFHSMADELLYGGAAGGGKTDLLVGLALTEHTESVIFRRQSTDLDGVWDRLTEVAGVNAIKNDTVKKTLRTADGRKIEGGHLEKPGSEKSWQGRPHDFIGIDEGAQLDEMKIAFVIQWLRSTRPGQRQRLVIATNPPLPEIVNGELVDMATGDYLIRWFAPWLDDKFPDPAEQGELRWCYMVREGDRYATKWVDGPGRYDIETGELMDDATDDDIQEGRVAQAKSRTFIKSLLRDNAFLKGTGYAERLSTTPEPMKSMLLAGDFTIKGDDHPMQVIPMNWVLQAEARFQERAHRVDRMRQLVLFADVAQGGVDTSVLAELLEEDTFGELQTRPGRDTPDGLTLTTFLLQHHRSRSLIALDAGGGYAGATMERLRDFHDIEAEMFMASHASTEWTSDGAYKFLNLRAEKWWRFREALDPKSEYEIAFPYNPRLRAQLVTPHFKVRGKMLLIESKDDIKKRLNGASTDEADATIGAWFYRDDAVLKQMRHEPDLIDRIVHGRTAQSMQEEMNTAVELKDPLEDW